MAMTTFFDPENDTLPIPDMELAHLMYTIRAIMPFVTINPDLYQQLLIAQSGDSVAAITKYDGITFDMACLVAMAERQMDLGGSEVETAPLVHPDWAEQHVVALEHKVSNSGNPTWYATLESGEKLYIRQSNKTPWVVAYPALEKMQLGDAAQAVGITVYTLPDEDKPEFLRAMHIVPGGTLELPPISDAMKRKYEVASKLAPVWESAVYLDLETTGKKPDEHEIVQYGIVTQYDDGGIRRLDSFVKPNNPAQLMVKDNGGVSAHDINGITVAMLVNSKTFDMHYDTLYQVLHDQVVVTYGDFDLKFLNAECERYELAPIVPSQHINLMALVGEYLGERNKWGTGWKWHPLGDAYAAIATGSYDNPHNALADAKALREIAEAMVNETALDDIPF